MTSGNSSNQRFSCGFGKVNLSNQSASYSVMRLRPKYTLDSAITTGKREAGTITFHPVSAQAYINGTMQRDYVTHPNGTVLMIQAKWSRNGRPNVLDGAVLVRLRQEAAMINVIAKLPVGRDSILGDSFSIFQGYADILSPDEAKEYGIVVPRAQIDMKFDPDEVDECFSIEEIVPERLGKPVLTAVSTAQGVVMQEVATGPARRMRFRKPQ